MVLESDVSKWTSWILICHWQEVTLLWNTELLISEKRVWLDVAIFRDDGHENEGLWVFQKDEVCHWVDFSWTYRRHYDELAALTQNRSEGMMNHRCEWTIKMITQPKQSRTWSEGSVMFKSDLLPKETIVRSSKIFPHYFFFTSLKRIAFAWSIIQPFGWIKNEVSLFNN